MFHHFAFFISYPLIKLLYRVKIVGKENLPKEGPVIVAGNHSSYLDSIMAGFSVFPRSPTYLGKESLFRIPVFNLLIRALGAIPIARDKADLKAIKRSLEVLKKGGMIIIFPEGTRHSEAVKKAFNGVSFLAYKSGAPIIPMAIVGTNKVMPEGARLPRLVKITVKIGKPLYFKGAGREDLGSLTKETMDRIIEML